MKKILILSANPTNTSSLRLDKEVREIQTGLERAKKKDEFEVISKWAVRPEDLRRALLDYEPQIVHFCGHGLGNGGLVLENHAGEAQIVSTEALANLFQLFETKIECVLLNACYSEVQAQAINQHINYVVGMNQSIGDAAAIKFAEGFYDALGAGKDVKLAFELGRNAIELENIPESLTPVIFIKKSDNYSLVSNENIYPTSTIEYPEGPVPLNSIFYIERPPIEAKCYETITQPGALIRIKAPRHMGKTSLITRILHHAKQQKYQAAYLNFQGEGAGFFSSLDIFLQWFCASIADKLNLPDNLSEYWNGFLGAQVKSTKYLERYLLPNINNALTLGLDEVDEIFKHPQIAPDFFGLLRSWHELAKNEPLWQKLRLIFVHSKEVYIPLNVNQSPFNVGLPLELPQLNQCQVQELVKRHGLNWSQWQLEQIMTLLGGHPYLVRMALYKIVRDQMAFEELLQIAATEQGPYDSHLRRHLLNLASDENLQAAVKFIFAADVPVELATVNYTEAFKLRSMGLVKSQGNQVMPLCDLYRQYFRYHLRFDRWT
ncbi:MAG: AAA-like domain-containing protein [Scytonematopsis contorta HA4267-MV1]|nr:AAA-like domain-containing protein [Scytonematopsis contorta HA4267-MV1]